MDTLWVLLSFHILIWMPMLKLCSWNEVSIKKQWTHTGTFGHDKGVHGWQYSRPGQGSSVLCATCLTLCILSSGFLHNSLYLSPAKLVFSWVLYCVRKSAKPKERLVEASVYSYWIRKTSKQLISKVSAGSLETGSSNWRTTYHLQGHNARIQLS